jgi:Family of unknown function (DUF5990)
VLIEVRAIELPGTQFEGRTGVCVGLRVKDQVTEPVAADAPQASWQTELRVRENDDGYDFTGPAVRGRRGDRALSLAWQDDHGELFRAAKLLLDRVPANLIAEALSNDRPIVVTVRLTDDTGGPLCATAPNTHVTWTLSA